MYLSDRHKKDIAYIIIVFVILIAILYSFYLHYSPKEDSVHFRTVILIDCSDSLSKRQKKSIMNDISAMNDNIVKNNIDKRKLIVFAIKGDAPTIPSPIISIVIDGRGEGVGAMTNNRWKRKNSNKIKELTVNIENILSNPDDSTQTPMFEYLKHISRVVKNDRIETIDELIIYSDFVQIIENKWPREKNKLKFSEYKKTKYYKETKIDLKNIDVKMRYIIREKYKEIQNGNHREFWKEYFQDVGAKYIDFVSIY
ncbi:MAG: hypothetical protein D3909_14650 [Candidatus Electrothrix sp. ATG1]|nr:hypothetical protein [Candidatus Electrothrix sp. ATG1]